MSPDYLALLVRAREIIEGLGPSDPREWAWSGTKTPTLPEMAALLFDISAALAEPDALAQAGKTPEQRR